MYNSLGPHGLQPARPLCSWDFPGKNTGVGCHFLIHGIFPTQGSNMCLLRLLYWQEDSLPLHYLGSPTIDIRDYNKARRVEMIQLSTRIDKLSDETKMGAQKKAISERKLIYKSCVTNKQERMNSNKQHYQNYLSIWNKSKLRSLTESIHSYSPRFIQLITIVITFKILEEIIGDFYLLY